MVTQAPDLGRVPGGLDEASVGYAAALQRQMLELEAAIASARATAAEANAEAARLEEASDAVAGAYEQVIQEMGGAP